LARPSQRACRFSGGGTAVACGVVAERRNDNKVELRGKNMKIVTSRTLALGAALLAACAAAAPASAVPVLDQQQADANTSNTVGTNDFHHQIAQSFTAGVDGTLAGIKLRIGVAAGSLDTGSLTVEIRNTQWGPASYGNGYIWTDIPGSPEFYPFTGEILASTTIDATTLQTVALSQGEVAPMSGLITFSVPVDLVAGDVYSILLKGAGATRFVWSGELYDPYSDGAGFARIDDGYGWSFYGLAGPIYADYSFETYVDGTAPVPEPAAIGLLGLGLIGLAGGLRMRRRTA
jgi:hypothetical protein